MQVGLKLILSTSFVNLMILSVYKKDFESTK
jgi:hypothetical protein